MQSFHVKASQNPHRLKIARIPAFWNYHASLWLSSKVSWDSWEFCPSAVLVHFVHYSRILGNLEPVRELCLLFSKAFRSFCWISSGFVPFKYSLESKLVMQNSGGIFTSTSTSLLNCSFDRSCQNSKNLEIKNPYRRKIGSKLILVQYRFYCSAKFLQPQHGHIWSITSHELNIENDGTQRKTLDSIEPIGKLQHFYFWF